MTAHSLRMFAPGCAAWLALAGAASAVTCNVGAPAADFGSYDVFSATPSTTTTTLSVTCTLDASDGGGNNNVCYSIAFSAGASNSFVQRQMKSGARHSLGYNLYSDSARTQVWGDGTGSSGTGRRHDAVESRALATDEHAYGLRPAPTPAGRRCRCLFGSDVADDHHVLTREGARAGRFGARAARRRRPGTAKTGDLAAGAVTQSTRRPG